MGKSGIITMRQLELIPRHLSIIRSDNVELSGNLLNSTQTDGKHECIVNQVTAIKWNIKNLGPDPCKFIFRVCPIQETNSGIVFHNSTEMIILGNSTEMLPILDVNESIAIETKFMFQKPGFVKISSHVQRLRDTENTGTEMDICWLQSGIKIIVVD